MTRGGRNIEIHVIVDGLGNPLHVQLTGGQISDITAAYELPEQLTVFRQNRIQPNHGMWTGGSIKSAAGWNVFFRRSKIIVALPHGTINWQFDFSVLYIWCVF